MSFARLSCSVFLIAALVAGCSVSIEAPPDNTTQPSTSPSKTKGDNADTDNGNQVEDDEGVCDGVPDSYGLCDPDAVEIAWFCLGEELYWLDCSTLDSEWECVELTGGWDCDTP